jgi:hypothetical protein
MKLAKKWISTEPQAKKKKKKKKLTKKTLSLVYFRIVKQEEKKEEMVPKVFGIWESPKVTLICIFLQETLWY